MSSKSAMCVNSLNRARPIREALEALEAPVAAFEPALAPPPAPAVAMVMRTSGSAWPTQRPGSSMNVS